MRKVCCAVHPHGRGDNALQATILTRGNGSPPRAWGQRIHDPCAAVVRRFTPTGVGTTEGIVGVVDGVGGSPPRAWGQRPRSCPAQKIIRFTPTGVGTTPLRGSSSAGMSVHPHGRGDNFGLMALSAPGRRFTPTGVGTTEACHFTGEGGDGSPPRAWGQQEDGGNNITSDPVHPHGRGDNYCFHGSVVALPRFTPTGVGTTACPHGNSFPSLGSPPRAWGQRVGTIAAGDPDGSPPRAWGQRNGRRYVHVEPPVHPHGRGDNIDNQIVGGGSERFTPTGVGTTPLALSGS